jgi:hypothetical protein
VTGVFGKRFWVVGGEGDWMAHPSGSALRHP